MKKNFFVKKPKTPIFVSQGGECFIGFCNHKNSQNEDESGSLSFV